MNNVPIDAIILHFALRNKKFMLDISKVAKAAYFISPFQEFFIIIHGIFLNPAIKEVLSLGALLDYCENNGLSDRKEYVKKVYGFVRDIKVDGRTLEDQDFAYFFKNFKDRYNSIVIRDANDKINAALSSHDSLPNINKVFETAIKEVKSIYKSEIFDEGSLGQDIGNIYEEYKFVSTSPETFKGVPSGFASLDALTNGFFGGELIIIAGFEGTGKSLLAMNMAVNAWLGSNRPGANPDHFQDDGHNIVYFSLEMPRSNRGQFTSAAYLNKRVVSCVSGVLFSDLRKGLLNEADAQTFNDTCTFIKKYDAHKKFYVVDIPRGATIDDIELKFLELREQFKIDLIVIDYIGLMDGAGDENEPDWEAQGKIGAGLHEFARIYNVPVITPVQVNRPSGTNHSLNKQNYNTTRIARSAMITQNANMVLQIGCRDQEENYMDMPLYIIKMRDAPKGILTFTKDFGRMRISDAVNNATDEDILGMEDMDLSNDDG